MTEVVLKGKKLYYSSNIFPASCSRELYKITISGVTLSTFEPVTELMVNYVTMKSASKTCSLDPIRTPLQLEILDCLLPSLTALTNSCLSSGLFPQVFKSAVIFPLLKKPCLDPNELKNFRPISNLPVISKIIEKLVLVQVSHHLSANNLLNQFQPAYRPGHLQKQVFWKSSMISLLPYTMGTFLFLLR